MSLYAPGKAIPLLCVGPLARWGTQLEGQGYRPPQGRCRSGYRCARPTSRPEGWSSLWRTREGADVSKGSSLILDPQLEPGRTCCWLKLLPPLPILGLLNQRQGLDWGTWVVPDSKHKKGTNLTLSCLQQPTLDQLSSGCPAVGWSVGQWPVMVKFQKEEKG